jgi:hypothetical protein
MSQKSVTLQGFLEFVSSQNSLLGRLRVHFNNKTRGKVVDRLSFFSLCTHHPCGASPFCIHTADACDVFVDPYDLPAARQLSVTCPPAGM